MHEYGGGSFAVLRSGALLFSTVEGVWLQAAVDAEPVQVVCLRFTGDLNWRRSGKRRNVAHHEEKLQILDSPSKALRFADFGVAPGDEYFVAVQEVALLGEYVSAKYGVNTRYSRIQYLRYCGTG